MSRDSARSRLENLVASASAEAEEKARSFESSGRRMVIRFAFARSGEMDNCHQVAAAPLSALPLARFAPRSSARPSAEQSAGPTISGETMRGVRIIDSRGQEKRSIKASERVPSFTGGVSPEEANNISYCECFARTRISAARSRGRCLRPKPKPKNPPTINCSSSA